ncbi:DUF3348 family protein, partial [Achromobacter sp.]|uniref:DUF3348 family protein n=1 Tax=Achromobacter sp. TaxID=134375 RepID=UPI002F95EEAA
DAIASDTAATAAKRPGPGQAHAPAKQLAALAEADADYANFRQRYLSLQHTMETAVGNLRSRLRGMVAAKNGEMTRLAVVDAIMDRALLPKERALFGVIPKLLQGHFNRLRDAEAAALTELAALAEAGAEGEAEAGIAPAQASITPGAWLDTFRKDMRSVLLAELDVRLQPVEGLLATLRAS